MIAPNENRPPEPTLASDASAADYNPWSYSLRTLFLLMFLFALVMALIVAVPLVGIVVAVCLALALLRTTAISYRRRKRTKLENSSKEVARLFLLSIWISLITVSLTAVAYLAGWFIFEFALNDPSKARVVGATSATGVLLLCLGILWRDWHLE